MLEARKAQVSTGLPGTACSDFNPLAGRPCDHCDCAMRDVYPEQLATAAVSARAQLIATRAEPSRPSNVVSLDKHAHLRRTVEEHHEALQVHQTVLQKHAEAHGVHVTAREAMKQQIDLAFMRERDITAAAIKDYALPRGLGFLGRLRWLLTGK